jgi:RNA polymerase sigma-70 factor (ECF subfamily)
MTRMSPQKEKLSVQEPDETLVDAAISGDEDSFTELCRRYYPAMVAIAHSIIGDRHLAEDAAQQAFAKAAVKLRRLKRKSQFAAWLAVICRNAAKDMAGSKQRLATNADLSALATDSNHDVVAEAVKEALGKLSVSEREVIFLRFYDGLSYEQVSAVLGISGQAINGRLRRAKRKMADYLRREGFSETKS